ncbi:hypothetical protein SAMN05661080_02709 [Modestobacter sp. DSM 44400]|uniref:hypothetical protein n=1 Tax=Modestobacter sp. DSM 44400 TaxID=1550230 RepID=UPI000898E371|nr:hypothetical protein [Modestobacter sp. DSM 44400]SDY21087.1 hypothetical protein SAMN05661080_02709 [Modestobacter sp. DSM 44400]
MQRGWQPPLPDMPAPPADRAWARLAPPEGYEPQWRRLVEAALAQDLGPDQLAETGMTPLAAARNWKPATVALYSKVARYGGVGLPLARTPEPEPLTLELRPLTEVRGEAPEHLRAVAWCALALGWPATVGQFRALRRDEVHPTTRRLLVHTDDGEWSVPGALTAWHAWESVRARFPALAASPWVLPALRRGPGVDSRVGGQLSTQALQVTFAKHAVRTALHLRATASARRREAVEGLAADYLTLSYDSYRRLALAAGAPPVSPRGAVRALRSVSRAARLAG